VACGGGGGGSGLAAGIGALDAVDDEVLIEPSSTPALLEMCERRGATISGPVTGTDYSIVTIPGGSSVSQFLKDIESEPAVRGARRSSRSARSTATRRAPRRA